MPSLNDLEAKAILRFSELLKKVLKNKELLEDFLNKLQPVVYKGTTLLVLNDNYISFKYPNGDSYSLQIDGSGIESYYSVRSENAFQKKTVSFVNDLVVVAIEESQSEIDEITSLPSSIERTTERVVYKNNEVVYERKYHSKATSTLNEFTSTTDSEETYVSDTRVAYRRNMSISNEEMNVPQVSYSKCYSYKPSPFNNRDNTEPREVPFFVPSNENEYIVYTLKLSKQEGQQKK